MEGSFRFVPVTVKFTATPSIVTKDQEIFRDPTPFSVTARSAGADGGPMIKQKMYGDLKVVFLELLGHFS